MALATDTPMAMVPTPPTTLDTTTARGRLKLSPRLMPTLTTTVLAMLDTALDTTAMLDTPMLPTASTTARGRLRLSLRPMPTLATMAMLVLDTTATLDTPMLT